MAMNPDNKTRVLTCGKKSKTSKQEDSKGSSTIEVKTNDP